MQEFVKLSNIVYRFSCSHLHLVSMRTSSPIVYINQSISQTLGYELPNEAGSHYSTE